MKAYKKSLHQYPISNFRFLLDNVKGISEHIIAVNIDIREFSQFCNSVKLCDLAIYISTFYKIIIDIYFPYALYYKATGDGLILVIKCSDNIWENIEIINHTINKSIALIDNFEDICKNEIKINIKIPNKIGIGISRGDSCCLISGNQIVDYFGRVLNLATRLMNVARPFGIVFDKNYGFSYLENSIKKLFDNEKIYVKGITNDAPITIYYLKNHVKIDEKYKISS